MKHIHNKMQSAISRFLPDLHHLPSKTSAKNALFFLGIFGFASMFYTTQVEASVNIDTSLSNNVMTIQQLIVKNGATAMVELSNLGIKLNLGTPSGVLKLDPATRYVTQGLVRGQDIDVNTIDGTKIQSGAINNSHIANNAITNSKIASGSITCDKLNIPGFSCTTTTANGTCPPGQYLQGISSGGVFTCVAGGVGGTGSLPVCTDGQTLVYSGGIRGCRYIDQGGPTGSSLWSKFTMTNAIYNNNLTGKVGIGLTNPSETLHVSGSVFVKGLGNIGECTSDGMCAAGQSCIFSGAAGGSCVNNGGVGAQCAGIMGLQCADGLVCVPNGGYRDPEISDQAGTCQNKLGSGNYTCSNGYLIPDVENDGIPNCGSIGCVNALLGASCTQYGNATIASTNGISSLATPDATAVLYVGNGKVGILTKTPEYALDVVGTIRAAQVLTLSDERLKTNIIPVADALDKLMQMNGYMYTLNIDGSTQYGVLAQEVERLFPYLVETDKNGYKSVNYNGLIAPIIESIHSLSTKINTVEKIYESNESRLEALEKKLQK